MGKTAVVVFFFLIFDCSLVFPTAQLVSARYYPVNVLFTQVPALFSDIFFSQDIQYGLHYHYL